MAQQDDQWPPVFDEEKARTLIGLHLLVGITRLDHDDTVIRQEQFHGEIVRASAAEGVILRLHNSGEERGLPPDLSVIEQAEPGTYRLKESGEVVVDPDLLATWTVYPPRI